MSAGIELKTIRKSYGDRLFYGESISGSLKSSPGLFTVIQFLTTPEIWRMSRLLNKDFRTNMSDGVIASAIVSKNVLGENDLIFLSDYRKKDAQFGASKGFRTVRKIILPKGKGSRDEGVRDTLVWLVDKIPAKASDSKEATESPTQLSSPEEVRLCGNAELVRRCSKINTLVLGAGLELSDESFELITGLPSLEVIHLATSAFKDSVLKEGEFKLLGKLEGLKSLWIQGKNLPMNVLQSIGEWKQLEVLALSYSAISNGDLQFLRNFKNLISLILVSNGLVTRDLQQILQPNVLLQGLDLSKNWIGTGAAQFFRDLAQQMPQLKILNLSRNPIEDQDIEPIGAMSQLTSLDLSFTDISAKTLKVLTNLKRLRHLTLIGCKKLSKKDIEDLKKSLPNTIVDFAK